MWLPRIVTAGVFPNNERAPRGTWWIAVLAVSLVAIAGTIAGMPPISFPQGTLAVQSPHFECLPVGAVPSRAPESGLTLVRPWSVPDAGIARYEFAGLRITRLVGARHGHSHNDALLTIVGVAAYFPLSLPAHTAHAGLTEMHDRGRQR